MVQPSKKNQFWAQGPILCLKAAKKTPLFKNVKLAKRARFEDLQKIKKHAPCSFEWEIHNSSLSWNRTSTAKILAYAQCLTDGQFNCMHTHSAVPAFAVSSHGILGTMEAWVWWWWRRDGVEWYFGCIWRMEEKQGRTAGRAMRNKYLALGSVPSRHKLWSWWQVWSQRKDQLCTKEVENCLCGGVGPRSHI